MKNHRLGDYWGATRRYGAAQLDLVLGSIILVCLIGGAVVYWAFSRPVDHRPTSEVKTAAEFRIDPKTASKIKLGMTATEVVGVIGKPAGNYASRPVYVIDGAGFASVRWIGDTHAIAVHFGADGKVDDYRCFRVSPCEKF